MPALAPYIPNRDSMLNNWVANFSALITATPALYGLTPTDAANIATPVATWTAAYALVTSPSTKTAQTVSDKNTARVTMLAIVRPYAQQISLNPGVSNSDKTALGLNPRTSTPGPITPPTSNPVLTIQSGSNLSIIMRYRDSAAGVSVKAKPYGVIACEIRYNTSATPIVDPTTLVGLNAATKSPTVLTFTSGDAGKQAYFAARWKTRTGGYSPWSPITNFTVPAGA